jgi:hypothetical protein
MFYGLIWLGVISTLMAYLPQKLTPSNANPALVGLELAPSEC